MRAAALGPALRRPVHEALRARAEGRPPGQDLFDAAAATVAAWQAKGARLARSRNDGAFEGDRPDAEALSSAVLGKPCAGWPGERWLDVRMRSFRPMVEARLDPCREKGFATVGPTL